MKKDQSFQARVYLRGVREGSPLCFYFTFIFVAIGAAYQAEGLGSFAAVLGTILIYSAPAQLATIDFLSYGAWTSLLITTAIVNARFMFMSASLLPHFHDQKKVTLAFAFQVVSATSFALTFTHCKRNPTSHAFSYFLGVISIGFPTAILATYIGASFVENIPADYLNILRVILPVYFTYALATTWPQKKPILAGLLGFILAPIIEYLIPQGGLILAAMISGFVVYFADQRFKLTKAQ